MRPAANLRISTSVRGALALALAASWPHLAGANPLQPTVVAGSVTIAETDRRLDVYQATDKAIIDWRSFSIAADEITRFHQPSAASIALNRVTGADPSHIFGSLQANGQIMLVNPNGVLFGPNARIDVAGLVATTADILNRDFLAGRHQFTIPSLNPRAMVENQGRITVAESGYAALVAPAVRNSGVITARLGRVTLGAAEAFVLDLYGDNLVSFRVGVRETPVTADGTPVAALVHNDGAVFADGGTVTLAAENIGAVVRNVINTEGIVQANSIEKRNGMVILGAIGPGVVRVSGSLSARGGDAGETGGTIKVLGELVGLFDRAVLDVSGAAGGGEVLVGGNFQGQGPEPNARQAHVAAGAVIRADALEEGDGGRVIVWSDEATRFYGAISAVGGTVGGDGGFAEVSGKAYLDYQGTADLRAAAGAAGTLLLDPNNITIETAGPDANITGATPFTSTDDTAILTTGTIETALGSANVVVTTATAGANTEAGDIIVNNAITAPATANSLTLQAHNDITLNANIDFTTNSSTGTFTAQADSDASGAGTFTVAGGAAVTTNNRTISVTADDIVLTGTLNSGTAATTITVSDGGTIGLGATAGNMTISGAELQNITATGLNIGNTSSGNITVDNITAANSNNISGTTTLATGGSITFGGTASTFNRLTANADDGIAVNVNLTTDTGNLALDGDDDNAADGNDNIAFAAGVTVAAAGTLTLDATNGGMTGAGALTLTGTGGVSLNDNLTTAGTTTIDADSDAVSFGSFLVNASKTLNTSGNPLLITANDIFLIGTINSGAAKTTLLVTQGDTIDLGNVIDSADNNVLELSDAELDLMTAGTLVIGDATAGTITISADISPGGTGILHLITGGGVTGTAGGIVETVLAITAGGTVNITDATTDVSTLAISAAGQSVTFTEANSLDLGSGDGVNGITAATFNLNAAGAVTDSQPSTVTGTATFNVGAGNDLVLDHGSNDFGTVAVTTGNNVTLVDASAISLAASTISGSLAVTAASGVTVSDDVTTNGTTTVDADSDDDGTGDFTVAATKGLNTTNNTLTVTANDLILNGTLNSGTAAATLLVSDGGTIGLGATAGNMTIGGGELQNITATGLTIGDNTNGAITVNGITAANSNNVAGTLTLNATADNASIAFSGGASIFNALAANADDRIAVGVNLTTDTGNLALDGDADNAVDTNDDVALTGGVTLTSAGTLSLASELDLDGNAHALTTAGGNVTLQSVVDSSGGGSTLTVSAGAGAFAAVGLNLGTPTSGTLTVTAATVNTGSSLVADTATLNGAVSGTGVNVRVLTLTGASANMAGTVNGLTGGLAANATNMPDASTHLVNGCTKTGCLPPPPEPPAPTEEELSTVYVVSTPDAGTTITTDFGSIDSGSTDTGSTDSGTTDSGSTDSGAAETDSGGTATAESDAGVEGDGDGAGSGDWAAGSFDVLSGDELMSLDLDSGLEAFLLSLDGAYFDDLDSELVDGEMTAFARELGDILGQYEIVLSSSIPTDAFGGKAAVLIPGLVNFQPTGDDDSDDLDGPMFYPAGFALYQQ